MKKVLSIIVFILLFPFNGLATLYYVDNAASGANDGTSWIDAWESFTDLESNWASVSAGDTIYISGGSSSKTYSEALNIGKSGTSGNLITFAAGALAPSPSGHDGTIIIDGGGSRSTGISTGGYNYIKVDGWSSSTQKIKIQNHYDSSIGENVGSGSLSVGSSDYVTIRGIHIEHPYNRGISGSNVDTLIVEYCYIDSTKHTNDRETDNISLFASASNYAQNVIIRYTELYQGADTGSGHDDNIHIINGYDNTVHGCLLKWYQDSGGSGADQNTMITYAEGYFKFYNNIVIGNPGNSGQGFYAGYEGNNNGPGTCDFYLWNNTFIGTHATGIIVKFEAISNTSIKAIKNNIFDAYHCWTTTIAFSDESIVDYNIYNDQGSGEHATEGSGWMNYASLRSNGFEPSKSDGDVADTGLDSTYHIDSIDDPPYNTGVDLSGQGITDDIDGDSRPQATYWDIGADEYVSGGDSTPPQISGTLPAGQQRCILSEWPYSTFSLQVTTDENATCKYDTSDVAYDSMANTFDTTGAQAHSQDILFLCGTEQTYYVRCKDASDNKNTSSEPISFVIEADPAPYKVIEVR